MKPESETSCSRQGDSVEIGVPEISHNGTHQTIDNEYLRFISKTMTDYDTYQGTSRAMFRFLNKMHILTGRDFERTLQYAFIEFVNPVGVVDPVRAVVAAYAEHGFQVAGRTIRDIYNEMFDGCIGLQYTSVQIIFDAIYPDWHIRITTDLNNIPEIVLDSIVCSIATWILHKKFQIDVSQQMYA